MPLKWFSCPDNNRIEISKCLSEGGCRMGTRCASRSYLHMAASDRPWKGKPSVTQLIGGTMLAFLKIKKDYAVSPDSRAFMIHGTTGHTKLELAGADDEFSLLEQKLDDETSTGITDAVEIECGKEILSDSKTSGSYKVAKALGFYTEDIETGEFFKTGKRKGQAKTEKILKRSEEKIDRWEWELQTNRYRIMYEAKTGHKIDELKIQCVVRDGGTHMARSRGVFRNVYYFKVPILPDKYIDSYFKAKATALLNALKVGECKTICSAQENWDGLRCERYCEVAECCPFGKYLKQEKEIEDMPIKGLSEIRRLPRLGKIRLGIKEKNAQGKEYPKEVPWFILDPSTPAKEENENLIREFHKLYGENPTQIKIMFPVADPTIFFQQDYKRYGSSTALKCKGDGDTATCGTAEFAAGLKIIGKTELGNPKVECKGRECQYYLSKECSECGVLSVLLPELPGAGVWQIVTGSYHSIVNVNSGIDYIRSVCGRAHMIPLTLERIPQEIGSEGKKRKHYILHINASFKLSEIQRLAQIDPEKSALALPEVEIEKEDIMFPETQSANGEVTPPKALPVQTLDKAENSRSSEDNMFIDFISSLDSVSTKEQMTTWWETVKNALQSAVITKNHYEKLVIERNVLVSSKGWDKK